MVRPTLFCFASFAAVTTATVGSGVLSGFQPPAVAQGTQTTKFFCDASGETPATVAQTPRRKITLIRWASTLGEFTPLKRCQEVSSRFQSFHQQGRLRFITSGRVRAANGAVNDVICVAADNNGPCLPDGQLFTLKPGSKPREVLKTMFRLNLAGGGEAILETTERLYVNMDDCLSSDVCSVAK